MPNPFYVKGSQRAAKVDELFGAIAGRYDRLNDIQSLGLHRLWKRRLVRLAAVNAGDRALDVCCGTGDIAFRLAAQGAAVTGLDFSEPMLTVARQRPTRPASSGPVEFVQGDAMQLPFPEASFAAVTVGYGLRNLADWRAGLREMVRVAQPGGRILVLDFGKPANTLLRHAYFLYLRTAVPLFGLLFCGSPSAYAYILESLRHYPAQIGVREQMLDAGLVDVQILNFLGGAMSINVGVKPPPTASSPVE
jgi:demethylmenaquinone methyltransferase/2-methoxy-6-polyprenyl-1,4-benzoquinol methylase